MTPTNGNGTISERSKFTLGVVVAVVGVAVWIVTTSVSTNAKVEANGEIIREIRTSVGEFSASVRDLNKTVARLEGRLEERDRKQP